MDTILIKRIGSNAIIPFKAYPGDAGYDLFSSEDVEILGQTTKNVPTGIHIALPAHFWGRITGRSSTWRGWNLLTIEGIIDTGYRGELFIGVYNPSLYDIQIPAGTRLAQLLIHRHEPTQLIEVDDLPYSERGSRGFGSSGK